ncbi:MAG: hypothetical protein FWG78_00350 [Coriobacteriia bacterium]|nr:hypothetical protein [Coriobacteriia bacterium]
MEQIEDGGKRSNDYDTEHEWSSDTDTARNEERSSLRTVPAFAPLPCKHNKRHARCNDPSRPRRHKDRSHIT